MRLALDNALKQNLYGPGIVVFAGAGISAPPPSSLPGWNALNSIILSAMTARVREYFDGRTDIDDLLNTLIVRREIGGTFPPDYQAQIMEEQCGETYFAALQALDIEAFNSVHVAIADLAAAGHVRAVITTNFDQLLERAFEARGVTCHSYCDAEEYRTLLASLSADRAAPIPIVKIHGSVHKRSSLVDTLKQRRRGRGPALHKVLAQLLARYYWLYCGFSGADLNYDKDYLGLRAAAAASPGFTFLYRPSERLGDGVKELREAYGAKAVLLAGTFDQLFEQLHPLSGEAAGSPPPTQDGAAQVRTRVEAWAAALHPMEAINILAALLQAAGQENAALWVLHRTWRSYRLPRDMSGPAYARYLFNYGRLALEQGETGYEETPQNLLRAREVVPEAEACFAQFCLYMGDFEQCISTLQGAFQRGRDECPSAFVIDRALASARVADLYGDHGPALKELAYACQRAVADGDEPRRGRVQALAARLWARNGYVDLAKAAQADAAAIARTLGEEVLEGEANLALAIVYYVENNLDGAWQALARAAELFARHHRVPLLATTYLEWTKVAYELGRLNECTALYEQAALCAAPLPAYEPQQYWLRARLETLARNFDSAREAVVLAREAAQRYHNTWMLGRIDQALAELDKASGKTES